MLVAHATWHGGALCLWAEHDGPRPVGGDGVHPFATRDFAGTSYEPLLRGAARVALELLLPGTGERPLPSGELGPEPFDGVPVLAPWRVPALVLEPFQAMELLRTAEDRADVVPGTDLRFLGLAPADAGALAAAGRVLPALREEDGDLLARWRPVLDPTRFARLAGAMPPACRAVAPGRPPAEVLAAALDALTDTVVRGAVPHPLLPPRTGRTPEHVSLAERWLTALTGPDPRVPREPGDDPAELRAELDAWHRAARPSHGPLRLTFRLVEPKAPEPEPGETVLPPVPGLRHASEPAPRPEAPTAPAASADPPDPAAPADPWAVEVPAEPPARSFAESPWRVEFLLQGTDDPSLLVPAARIWSGDALLEGAEETLLGGLGRALRLFPELNRALDTAVPAELVLDTAGAFRFLRTAAPLLAAAGFGVLLPTWAGRSRLGLKLRTAEADGEQEGGAAKGSGFGLGDLVEFRWELAVGEESLDEDDLAELARLKAPLVRLRGRWVELDEEQLESALEFLRSGRAGTMTAGQAVRAVVHAGERTLPLVAVEAKGPLGDLLSGEADRRLAPVAAPAGIEAVLRPYQERGLAWLSFMEGLGLGALLADDMGLGKTLTVLSHLVHAGAGAHDAAGAAGPTLAVVPMSLVGNWQREAARFAPKLRLYVHHGAKRHKEEDLVRAAGAADLVLTTYGTAARDAGQLAQVAWARIVCDEAQALKNSGTRQARAVRSIPARSRIALTGTPVENHLTELWSIMEFANPGLLGPRESFRERFAVPIENEGDERAAAALKRATQPFILRRLKTDRSIITDLPEKQEMKVYCNLTVEQASLYQATVEDMLEEIAEADARQRRGLVLAAMAKLKQVCDHPALLLKDGSRLQGRSGKLEELERLCAEILDRGEKVLVFTQYASFGSMLQPYLAARLGCASPGDDPRAPEGRSGRSSLRSGRPDRALLGDDPQTPEGRSGRSSLRSGRPDRSVLWLHGGTSKEQRDELVQRFQNEGTPSVFLLSLKAAGTGLTLTAANHVVHFDRWWNPAVEDQATDRAFRIGQTRDVQVRKFVCVGTMEERVDEMIERKKALAESIVGTGEEWLTGLSVAELRDVLRLSPDAVSA
ncbi:DEAD/DEAH box helicase [Actinocorallia libanotica]|uniref:SNF2 family DNA or RNA helicase n=1 Tax=Actinocorallia libanotica TaxID=46162 RepID=A0ABP4CE72_9ACTN